MILNDIENTIKDIGKQQRKMTSMASQVFSQAMNSKDLSDEQKERIKAARKLTKELEGCKDANRVNEIISELNENN